MSSTITGEPRYTAEDFKAPEKSCDLVMKGGVTSGVVYPYAILQLAQEYRFRSIGGTSAGAIAAAFAAAAEFGRQSGDPGAFARLEARCLEIPSILEGLFQPSKPLRPLMRGLQAWSKGQGPLRAVSAAAWFWRAGLLGALAGAAVLYAVEALLTRRLAIPLGGLPGVLLAALLGLVVGPGLQIWRLLTRTLPASNFGFCSGMPAAGSAGPALTDWLHRSLQFIAFGDETHPIPLTFGALARVGLGKDEILSGARSIDLRMITTNLSMQRPHALPELGGDFLLPVEAWRRLFPEPVIDYLCEATEEAPGVAGHRQAPDPDHWPVVCAVRMSLSFPLLIEAVPMATRDLAPVAAEADISDEAVPPAKVKRVLFSDGGLSSNFPIHFFDALLPTRPTFALSLDPLAPGDDQTKRVSMPQTAAGGSFIPITPIESLGGFAGAILGAAKDWQDQLLSVMPGQRERIVHVKLAADEGGLNLAMPQKKSLALMSYGDEAGALIRGKFDFDEHRWRRTLVAYEQLQSSLETLDRIWPEFGARFQAYAPHVKSYKRVPGADRGKIHDRLGALAGTAETFRPPIKTKGRFPRPAGRLRIVPDV